ncbi:hypothetical protein FHX75_111735 [Micromonospora palomenae]|uniref:Uncharacterized protein n=1 Tax=Micromonospora palomenae TaxID=1461247 RepID=A0A561WXJ2_9ACTN|nr:hypothetical protein FHX75_111735 [Micromonospora palomenae]
MPSPDDFTLSVSRPSFRALLITCALGTREIDVYGEVIPDSPDYDWSIVLSQPLHWTRPGVREGRSQVSVVCSVRK